MNIRGSCGKRDADGERCTAHYGHKGRHYAFYAPEGPRWFWDDGRRTKALPWRFRVLSNFQCSESEQKEAT